jgi:ribosomal protein S12 methylthiotransferase
LKIAEGCDNLCSFCSIPAIRGPHKSRPEDEILAEAKQLTEQGIKELILISQDTTYYGREKRSDSTLASLLRKMEKNSSVNWIRLLYTNPERVTDELIEVIADSEKICPYIDIPLQHVSDRILRDMKRGVRREKIEQLIEKLRSRIQNLAIRTSFIVGFPGETEEEFEELYNFVRQQKFERLGVFKFSAEEGTDAANFDEQVSEDVKLDRFNILMELQHDIGYSINQNWVGKKIEIIVDQHNNRSEKSIGRTKWDAPEIDHTVYLGSEVNPGSFVTGTVLDATAYDLYASVCP